MSNTINCFDKQNNLIIKQGSINGPDGIEFIYLLLQYFIFKGIKKSYKTLQS